MQSVQKICENIHDVQKISQNMTKYAIYVGSIMIFCIFFTKYAPGTSSLLMALAGLVTWARAFRLQRMVLLYSTIRAICPSRHQRRCASVCQRCASVPCQCSVCVCHCHGPSANQTCAILCAISSNIVQYWQYVQFIRTQSCNMY